MVLKDDSQPHIWRRALRTEAIRVGGFAKDTRGERGRAEIPALLSIEVSPGPARMRPDQVVQPAIEVRWSREATGRADHEGWHGLRPLLRSHHVRSHANVSAHDAQQETRDTQRLEKETR